MGTPSARPSGPQSWVRGPKSPQPTPPEPRAAPHDDATGPTAEPATRAPSSTTPDGQQTASPTTADFPATSVPPVAAAPPVQAPVRTAAPASPRTAARPAPASQRTAPPRRATPAPATEAPWDTPGRTRTARGRSRDEVGWVKAHGGAGTTSLVEALGGVDLGARWPDPARGEPRRIVLVGRTSAGGLQAVSRALGALTEGDAPHGLDLLGVVLVADAPGRLPLSLLRRIRVLRSAARVHRVPWIPAWRMGGRPAAAPRQLSVLAKLVGGELYAEGTVS